MASIMDSVTGFVDKASNAANALLKGVSPDAMKKAVQLEKDLRSNNPKAYQEMDADAWKVVGDKYKGAKDTPENKKFQEKIAIGQEMLAAADDLKAGNIDKAVELGAKGLGSGHAPFVAFDALTAKANQKIANEAKLKLAAELAKEYRHNDKREDIVDSKRKKAGFDYGMQAVKSYGASGYLKECTEALSGLKEDHPVLVAHDSEKLTENLENVDPELATVALAVIELKEQQGKELSFEENTAILVLHPEEDSKIKAIENINKLMNVPEVHDNWVRIDPLQDIEQIKAETEVRGNKNIGFASRQRGITYSNSLTPEQTDAHLDRLTNIVKTSGESTPSQHAAMEAITTTYSKEYLPTEPGDAPTPKGEKILAIAQDGLTTGAPHIVKEFINGGLLEGINRSEQAKTLEGEKPAQVKITDILTPDLQGPHINNARIEIAKHYVDSMVKITPDVKNSNLSGLAKQAAVLTRDVIADPTSKGSKAAKDAEDNLRQVCVLEHTRMKLEKAAYAADVATVKEELKVSYGLTDNELSTNAHAKGILEVKQEKFNNLPPMGYGIAAVGTLKDVIGTKAAEEAAERIEKQLKEALVSPTQSQLPPPPSPQQQPGSGNKG